MRTKNKTSSANQIYDLSNMHFQNAEVITKENKSLKGQFVKFKLMLNDNKENFLLFPSEKYYFLPQKNKKEYWDAYKSNKGVFSEMPLYIKELGLNDIIKIIIEPALVF